MPSSAIPARSSSPPRAAPTACTAQASGITRTPSSTPFPTPIRPPRPSPAVHGDDLRRQHRRPGRPSPPLQRPQQKLLLRRLRGLAPSRAGHPQRSRPQHIDEAGRLLQLRRAQWLRRKQLCRPLQSLHRRHIRHHDSERLDQPDCAEYAEAVLSRSQHRQSRRPTPTTASPTTRPTSTPAATPISSTFAATSTSAPTRNSSSGASSPGRTSPSRSPEQLLVPSYLAHQPEPLSEGRYQLEHQAKPHQRRRLRLHALHQRPKRQL